MATSRANSRAKGAETQEIEGEFLEHETDPADEDAQIDLTNLLADIGDPNDAAVHVYRQKEGTKKLSWIHTFAPSELDIGSLFHSLRHEMGGGMFRLQVRENGRIVKSKTVEIEPPTKKETDAVQSNLYGGFDPVAMLKEMREGGGGNSSLEMMMNMMMQQSRDTQALVGKLIESSATRHHDNPQPTMRDMVETIVAIQQLNGGNKSDDSVKMLIQGIEIAREFGGGGGETNFMDVLAKSLSTFGGSLSEMAKSQQGQQEVRALMNPNQQPAQQTPQRTPQETDPAKIQALPDDHVLKPYEGTILMLIDCAIKDRNPETYAEVIVDQMGEEVARGVFLNREYLAMVVNVYPIIAQYGAWFDELIAAVDYMTTESDDTDSSTPDGTDKSHVDEATPPKRFITDQDAEHVDGHTERAGRGTGHLADHGEPGESGENTNANPGNGTESDSDGAEQTLSG